MRFTAGGGTIRVVLEPGSCSSGVLLAIEIEDDEVWHREAVLDSHFLPELLNGCKAATQARKAMQIDWPGKAVAKK